MNSDQSPSDINRRTMIASMALLPVGGASNDWRPDLQRPDNPVPLLDMKKPPNVKALGID